MRLQSILYKSILTGIEEFSINVFVKIQTQPFHEKKTCTDRYSIFLGSLFFSIKTLFKVSNPISVKLSGNL
jgi:hypothetical protein